MKRWIVKQVFYLAKWIGYDLLGEATIVNGPKYNPFLAKISWKCRFLCERTLHPWLIKN